MKKSCVQATFLVALLAGVGFSHGLVQAEQITGERAKEICAAGDTGPVTSYGEFPEETAAKRIVFEWNCAMMVERNVEAAFERYVAEDWCDHAHMVTRGENRCGTYEETMALFARMNSEPLEDDEIIEFPTQYMVNGDHVTVYGAGVDIFRVVNGKLTDHWDASPTRAISFEDKPEGMAERIMSGQMFQGPETDE